MKECKCKEVRSVILHLKFGVKFLFSLQHILFITKNKSLEEAMDCK